MNADQGDDALLEWLRQVALQADPVPEGVSAAARAAIGMHDLDGRLAELIADSAGAVPGLEYDAVRRATTDGSTERLLSFEGEGVRVEVEIAPGAEGLTVIGQLVGAAPAECQLEYGDGRRETVQLDDLGRFLLEQWPPGPVRIRCRSARGTPVITSWVNL
ncbi:hypothetical protein [Streptomyces sp. SID13031]|uniref:hypothetical protein n=1 Tax=Streptomyces sp. SID13031 TaxID=2706046 RepID=UPI0013CB1614|nr:hypothetical protein [Streptomyces sp. SID13031]NEA30701.1 hypothetical protein [Streptomyces sp. SID13031]